MSGRSSKQTIRDWWATSPMTYGTVHGETDYESEKDSDKHIHFGTREFFEQVDQTFCEWSWPLHSDEGVFARIFPYRNYKDRNVLEIGCGMGTMAMAWANQGAKITAVDLNPVSVMQTRQRFNLFELDGVIAQADANALSFGDGAFDYVYSWGVLHHSPALGRSIKELFRVLRPGGEFGVMLYGRESFFYRYHIQYVEGFLHAESRFLDSLQLASRYTDGAREEGNPHTWPVTRAEVRELFSPHCRDLNIQAFGLELDWVLKFLIPKIGGRLPRWMKKPWARRWGWSLWITGTKQ